MKFALIINNEIKEYREYPSQPDCKIIGGLPVIRPVVEGTKPAFDPQTEQLAKTETIQPTQVDWTYSVVPLPAETIAANQQAAADAQARLDVKADAFVQTFIEMTPAQVTTYITNNVTDLASAKSVINKLALMVLFLAKREYR